MAGGGGVALRGGGGLPPGDADRAAAPAGGGGGSELAAGSDRRGAAAAGAGRVPRRRYGTVRAYDAACGGHDAGLVRSGIDRQRVDATLSLYRLGPAGTAARSQGAAGVRGADAGGGTAAAGVPRAANGLAGRQLGDWGRGGQSVLERGVARGAAGGAAG